MTEPSTPPVTPSQPALIRHIIPVLIGGALIAVLTLVTGNWLNAHGWLPAAVSSSPGLLLFALLYRTVFIVIGCHMASRLAPDGQPRIRYALAVGVLLVLLGVASSATVWGQFPTWYLLAGIVLPIPAAIVGGGTATRAMARGGR